METFNWKVGAIVLALFIASACLRAIATDDTEPDCGGHYIWYLMIWVVVVVESIVLWCVAG